MRKFKRPYIHFVLIAALHFSCASSQKDQEVESPVETEEEVKVPEKKKETVYKTKIDDASEAEISKAVQLASQGEVDKAYEKLSEVVKSQPKAFIAHFNLGILEERKGEFEKAAAKYQQALAIESDFTPALINWVRLEMRQGKSGIGLADRFIGTNPDNFEHQYAKLEALIGASRYDEAARLIQSLLPRDEASTKLRYYMGLVEFRKGRFLLSEYVLDQALNIGTRDAEVYFLKALVALKLDKIIDAQNMVSRALSLNPDHLEANWLNGLMSYDVRNISLAYDMFSKALTLNPTLFELHLNLGNVLKVQGKAKEAEEVLTKAKAIKEDGRVLFSLGTLYLSAGTLKLESVEGMERLKLALDYFVKAKAKWTSKEDKALADEYIAKTERAIEILEIELDLADFDDDPFGDDPFGDDPFGDDPFGDGGDSKSDEGSLRLD